MIKTMTLNEATAYLREHGLKITNVSLADGLRQGKYPFGVFIETGDTGVFQIYTRLLDKWIEERWVS